MPCRSSAAGQSSRLDRHMDMSMYPRMVAAAYIKRQPSYNLFFFDHFGERHSVGMDEVACTIVETCTGDKTLHEVVLKLVEEYQDSEQSVEEKLMPFLKQLEVAGIVTFSENPHFDPIKIVGTKELVTVEQVILELTYSCPLKCRHCFVEAGAGPSMNYRVLRDILTTKLLPIGIRAVQLTGGEPFVYNELEEIVSLFVRERIPLQLTTSGFVLNDQAKRVIDLLSKSMSSIQVSIDGLSDYHDHLRGVTGAFNRAVNFIEYAIGQNVKVFSAITLINQRESEIYSLCAMMRNKGVSLFRLGAVSPQGRASNLNDTLSWDVKRVRSFIKSLGILFNTDSFKVGWIEDPDDNLSLSNCGAGTKMLVINPHFTVRACPMIPDDFGNIMDESLETIMRRGNDFYLGLRSPRNETCENCPEVDNCKGCMAAGLANAHKVGLCYWHKKEYGLGRRSRE